MGVWSFIRWMLRPNWMADFLTKRIDSPKTSPFESQIGMLYCSVIRYICYNHNCSGRLASYLHLATSEMWCWSGRTGILTRLSLCYNTVYCYNGAQRYERAVLTGQSAISDSHWQSITDSPQLHAITANWTHGAACIHTTARHCRLYLATVWLRGNEPDSINVVTLHRDRLVLGWAVVLWRGKPPHCRTKHPVQVSRSMPPWVGTMSNR